MIRSLSRGLAVLTVLNKRDSASAAELAIALDAPRATIYRIIGTLVDQGYIYQHKSDRRFRITSKVQALSDGFTDESHMVNISYPFLSRLTRKFQWPVALATISGIDLIIRENTDLESPLATEQFTIGYRMPVLRTASGLCILAHMDASRRSVILRMLRKSDRKYQHSDRQRKALEHRLESIKSQGYSVHHRPQRISDLTAVSAPILSKKEVVRGAVTIRYARAVSTLPEAIDRFVPDLRKSAESIAQRIDLHLERQKRSETRNFRN